MKNLMFILVVMIAPSAMAALILETETFTGDNTLTFDQFNTSLGTLTSIEIVFDLSIDNGWLIADNDGVDQANVIIELGAVAAISSTDVSLIDGSLQPVVGSLVASTAAAVSLAADNGDGPGNVDASAPDGTTLYGGPDSDSDSGFISALAFAGYIGTGTFDIVVAVTELIDLGGLGDIEGSFSAVDILNPSSSVRVNYTYTPIPEPTTMALLGLGSVILSRKRRA